LEHLDCRAARKRFDGVAAAVRDSVDTESKTVGYIGGLSGRGGSPDTGGTDQEQTLAHDIPRANVISRVF
jgi:hypothetical protein